MGFIKSPGGKDFSIFLSSSVFFVEGLLPDSFPVQVLIELSKVSNSSLVLFSKSLVFIPNRSAISLASILSYVVVIPSTVQISVFCKTQSPFVSMLLNNLLKYSDIILS
ncbi:MAG: hypothetical protein LBU14_00775 [Candidatus Peribacteria bacterium]|jgi:hypothetical protein|nr:hypothetical protein [Candidatus Peribacteria bacterium]